MLGQVLAGVNGGVQAPGGEMLVVAINLISVGLLVGLLVLFVGTWRKTRAPFTLGLVLFAGVLLLEDLTRVAAAFRVLRPGFVVLPELFEMVALVVLLYLATR